MGKYFQFVQDFTESWKLVPLQYLVENFIPGMRIQDAVMVLVGVGMEIMIPEQRPQIFHPGSIAVREPSNSELPAGVADSQPFLHFQNDAAQTEHPSALGNHVIRLCVVENDRVGPLVINKRMLLYSDFVDSSVVVVGIPVVGVSLALSH